jgi:hypothetical protein
MSPVSFQSRAVGVPSKGEDPVTAVRSADGGSRNAIPRHVIPERGQIPENGTPHGSVMDREKVRHVLDEHVAGSKLANDPLELGPQRSLRMSETSPLPGARSPLTREAAGDTIDGSEIVGADGTDVIVNRDPWEPALEDSAAVLVTLDEPSMPMPGLGEPEIKEPGPGEQRPDIHDRQTSVKRQSIPASTATRPASVINAADWPVSRPQSSSSWTSSGSPSTITPRPAASKAVYGPIIASPPPDPSPH